MPHKATEAPRPPQKRPPRRTRGRAGRSQAAHLPGLNQGGTAPDSTINAGRFLFGGSAAATNTPQITGTASGDLSSAATVGH